MNIRKQMAIDIGLVETARLERGLLYCELAQAAGVSKSAVHKAIRQKRCGVKVARRIAAALGLDLKDLWVNAPAERRW